MKIYIIRHGETEANAQRRLQGWSDYPLNQVGISLAKVTGEALREVRFDRAYSSPLLRARQTAELVLESSGNTPVPILLDDRIKEINLGCWEDKRLDEEANELPAEQVRMFFENPFALGQVPGGESVEQVCARTQAFLRELADSSSPGETVLVSTHGCALRAMLNCLYEDKKDFWHGHVPYNCAVNIVEVSPEGMKLVGDDIIYYHRSDCIDRYAHY